MKPNIFRMLSSLHVFIAQVTNETFPILSFHAVFETPGVFNSKTHLSWIGHISMAQYPEVVPGYHTGQHIASSSPLDWI